MKILLPILIFILVSISLPTIVSAAPDCKNCAPTTVVVNTDNTITVSTTATGVTDCIGVANNSKGSCNVVIASSSGMTFYDATGGSPVTIPISPFWNCPCTARFREHQGQWHYISAESLPFVIN